MRLFILIVMLFVPTVQVCEATFTDVDNWPYRANDEEVTSFEDISTTGTRVLNGSDNGTAEIPIGFYFSFYHQEFLEVSVSPNGLVTLGGTNTQSGNVNLTTTAPTGNFPSIAVLWDDWHFISNNDGEGCCSDADGAYYQTLGTAGQRRFVIQWNKAYGVTSSPSSVTFEVILYEGTNRTVMLYQDVTSGDTRDAGAGSTVGIRNTSGQVTCLAVNVSFGRCFTPARCEERIQWSLNSGVITSSTVLEYNNSPHYVFASRFSSVNPGSNAYEDVEFAPATSTLWIQGQQSGDAADAMAEITKTGTAVSNFIGRASLPGGSAPSLFDMAVLGDGRLITTRLSTDNSGDPGDPEYDGATIYQTDGTQDDTFDYNFVNVGYPCEGFGSLNPATIFNPDSGRILINCSNVSPLRFRTGIYQSDGTFDGLRFTVDPAWSNNSWEGGTYHRIRQTIWTVDASNYIYEMDTSGNELHRYNFTDCSAKQLTGLTFDDEGNLYLSDDEPGGSSDSIRKLNPFSATLGADWGWTHRP